MQTLTTVTLWLSVMLRLNVVNCKECRAMDIRNEPKNLLALANCTAILGSLSIILITDTNYTDEINQYSFPDLKEITGYLLLYNVIGLNSTGRLFPNLTLIRGQQLILSYSLAIFQLPHLTEIGLRSLISIKRGYVFIERCPALCYHNTIDWEAITDEDEEDLGAGKGNIIQVVDPKCPTKESCRACDNENCWSSFNCQKYNTILSKCHDLCLGGCQNKTAEGCNVCSGLKLNGTCVAKCPSDFFILPETMRCVPAGKCRSAKLIPFNGECLRQCPDTYSNQNPDTNQIHDYKCFKCRIKCPQKCRGGEIIGASDLEHFRGCNIVYGTLSIKLGLNMTDIKEKLEQTLGAIETVNGALRIYRSFSLTSISFLRNLILINTTADLPYGIEITENDNLQTLFDNKEKLNLKIIGGGMSFHYNSKLCMEVIHEFQQNVEYDNTHDSIGYDTNGYDEICHATGGFQMYFSDFNSPVKLSVLRISAFHVVDSHYSVRIYWNITDLGSNKRLIGYFVYYLEAPTRNISYFSGLDACSTKKFSGTSIKDMGMPMISKNRNSEIWQSVFVPFENLKTEKGFFEMTLINLKQYTQYAYYIRTQISLKHKDQMLNVTQGQSPLKYFITMPDRPKPPIVRTKDKTNVTITLEWNPSTPENEYVQEYYIDVYELVDNVDEIDQRNYCRNPKVRRYEKEDITTPEVICCRDQRAYLEYFQRVGDQTCGKYDPSCKKTYEYILFHRHVENVLHMANLEKQSSEHYQEPQKSPKHRKGSVDRIKQKSEHSKYYLTSHVINGVTKSAIVPNLKPFHLYTFHVYACNHISNCSDYFFHSDRTEPFSDADDIGITAMPDERRTDIVTLIIRPPLEPNGATIAYEIEIYDVNRDVSNLTCITRKEMAEMNYTYRFENLLYGTHSFRVRTLSLGQDGEFSDFVIVEVDRLSNNTFNVVWGIALTFIFISLIIVATTFYRKCKDCRVPRTLDTDYLLRERRDSERRDSDYGMIQQSKIPIGVPLSEQVPSTISGSRIPVQSTSDGIQMTVFKSNVSRSTLSLDQPSTSSVENPTKSSGVIPGEGGTLHSQPNSTIFSRILQSLQNLNPTQDRSSSRTPMGDAGISLQYDFTSRLTETARSFMDESDYAFPLLPE